MMSILAKLFTRQHVHMAISYTYQYATGHARTQQHACLLNRNAQVLTRFTFEKSAHMAKPGENWKMSTTLPEYD
jgi:hypothetical protein